MRGASLPALIFFSQTLTCLQFDAKQLMGVKFKTKISSSSFSFLDSFHLAGPQISNIARWHSYLMTQDVFSKTYSEVTGNKGVIAFKVRKIRTLRCYNGDGSEYFL